MGQHTSLRRGELEQAFVLHRRAYRDTSALVELFTLEHGRVGAVARGVRRRRSSLAAVLQPFQPLIVSWQARGELATLTGAEGAGRALALTGRHLVSGFYANELLLRMLGREDPHPDLFPSYARLLGALAEHAAEGPALRGFERDLLAATGYGLLLERDAEGMPVERDAWYRYDLESGPTRVSRAAGPGVHVSGSALLALHHDHQTAADDPALKRLMRAALRLYIGDRPLKSREMYARYRSDQDE